MGKAFLHRQLFSCRPDNLDHAFMQQDSCLAVQNQVREFQLRAERKLGEMLKEAVQIGKLYAKPVVHFNVSSPDSLRRGYH